MPHIGQVIRILRTAKGWKQGILAKRCHVDQSLICKYELEQAEPSLHTLRKLAKAFDLSLAVFVDLSTDTESAVGLHRAVLDVCMAETNLVGLL